MILVNRAFRDGIPVKVNKYLRENGDAVTEPGALLFIPATREQREKVERWGKELGLKLRRVKEDANAEAWQSVSPRRLGLYHPWTASMDEGWTRFILEQFEFDFAPVYNADIRAGDLNRRYDVIVFPDASASSILRGMEESSTAPEYVGGIGETGVIALQDFVDQGGRLIFLDSACGLALDYFDLPVRNVLAGVKREDFYCPGSILQIDLRRDSPLAYGMSQRAGAYFAHSLAFATVEEAKKPIRTTGPRVGKLEVVAEYDDTVTLLSGWILGAERIHGMGAVVRVPYGEGDVLLFGFRVQHRAQSHGTFRLLFNGMLF